MERKREGERDFFKKKGVGRGRRVDGERKATAKKAKKKGEKEKKEKRRRR